MHGKGLYLMIYLTSLIPPNFISFISLFFETVSCSSGWLRIHYVAKAGLELLIFPTSVSQMLRLQACPTAPGITSSIFKYSYTIITLVVHLYFGCVFWRIFLCSPLTLNSVIILAQLLSFGITVCVAAPRSQVEVEDVAQLIRVLTHNAQSPRFHLSTT